MTGIWSRFASREVAIYNQGDAYIRRRIYSAGPPPGQGSPNINLDRINTEMETNDPRALGNVIKGEDPKGNGKLKVDLCEPRTFSYPIPGSGTEWLARINVGTLEELEEYIRDVFYTAVGGVFYKKTFDQLLETEESFVKVPNPRVKGKFKKFKVSRNKVCAEIDRIMMGIFKKDGVMLELHTTMAQPKLEKAAGDAFASSSLIYQYSEAVKAANPGMDEIDVMYNVRLLMKLSSENNQTIKLDPKTAELLGNILSKVVK
jgi:hypothetical protein